MTSKERLRRKVEDLEGPDENREVEVYFRGLDGILRKNGKPVDEKEVESPDDRFVINIKRYEGGENE